MLLADHKAKVMPNLLLHTLALVLTKNAPIWKLWADKIFKTTNCQINNTDIFEFVLFKYHKNKKSIYKITELNFYSIKPHLCKSSGLVP